MQQGVGIWSAALSSALGGSAIAATRLLGGSVAPELLAVLRFGVAAAVLVPLSLLLVRRRFARRELITAMLLGALGFGIFPVIYNGSISLTTASRAAMALCTMPLFTMLLAAALGLERLTVKRSLGVVIAMVGVALALLGGLGDAPPGAWRGDLLMLGGTSLMAVFNVQSRRPIAQMGVLGFTCVAVLSGSVLLALAVGLRGGFDALHDFTAQTWAVVAYLGLLGGVAAHLLWSVALKLAPVTVVAVSVTVSPLAATVIAALLLDETIGFSLLAGLAAVGLGIWLAASRPRAAA